MDEESHNPMSATLPMKRSSKPEDYSQILDISQIREQNVSHLRENNPGGLHASADEDDVDL